MSDTLTLRAINRATLARQMLLRRERVRVPQAIERLVAMQAQWPRPPFVGLWTRLEGFRREDLAALFRKKQVVRATFLRGTIHVLTAKDFLALRPAIAPALEHGLQAILKERLGALDVDALTARARAILGRQPCTFEELRDRFLQDEPTADARAMGYTVRMLLPLIQVPDEAPWAFPAQACFALADKWLGRALPKSRSSAEALVRRYLAGYGPASVVDAQAWSGLPGLRDTFEALRPRLRVFRDEQRRELFDLPDAPRPKADVPAPVRFVPDYDNVVLTRRDERFVAQRHRSKVFLSALRIAATVLVDGFVAGTWKVERAKKGATLTVTPFASFAPAVRREVEAEGDALVRFVEPDAAAFDVRIGR